jgi:hypothetical protein
MEMADSGFPPFFFSSYVQGTDYMESFQPGLNFNQVTKLKLIYDYMARFNPELKFQLFKPW